MAGLLFVIVFDDVEDEPTPPYIPKRKRGPKSNWLKSFANRIDKAAQSALQFKPTTRQSSSTGYPLGYQRKKRLKRLIFHSSWCAPTQADSVPQADTATATTKCTMDSDTVEITIDNCCSTSITNSMKDFVMPPKAIKGRVRGLSGAPLQATHVGTVLWRLEDDTGQVHDIRLRGTYLVPKAPTRLLAPQHWAQTARDHAPIQEGTGCLTTSKEIILFWKQRQFKKTIPLSATTNVGVTTTAPGIKTYQAYCTQVREQHETVPVCFITMVSDDEDDFDGEVELDDQSFTSDPVAPPPSRPDPLPQATLQSAEAVTHQPQKVQFTVDKATGPHLIPPEEEPSTLSNKDQLLRWHYRLGHLPFSRLIHMAKSGVLPSGLATCPQPFCSACQYGKLTRKPWQTKGGPEKSVTKQITTPGQVVSVDQLESTTAGFIAQLKGKLTVQRYKYATVFVDQCSRYSFVYLQKRITSEETVQAKQAFERHAGLFGVKILQYHCDNGRFVDNGFITDCKLKGQRITYCGVNAHFQNGIAEKTIRDRQEQARTMLLFALEKWPRMLLINLWPYALRTANEVANSTPTTKGDPSPLEKFAGVQVQPKLRNFHTFGCPTYVLQDKLQSGQSLPKWHSRARLGIYLGPSPSHARSVSLVLNPRTGHVSPQFHIKHDDFFETVTGKPTNYDSPQPTWKVLSQLVTGPPVAQGKHFSSHAPHTLQATGNLRGLPKTSVQEVANEPLPDLPELEGAQLVADAAPPEPAPHPLEHTTRSGRVIRPPQRYSDGWEPRQQGLVAWEVLVDQDDSEDTPTAAQQYQIQENMVDPIAFATSSDPDVMYLHEALRAHDRRQFLEAMDVEIQGHVKGKHWIVVPRTDVPKGTRILDAVWSMRRKRRLDTREIYKWKARLNVHGGQQEHGVNYWETYAPVVMWPTIRIFFILSILLGWYSRQLDFVMAFPHAPVEVPLFMNIPKGYRLKDASTQTHVLRLLKNIYGQKQGPRVWNRYLDQGLKEIGFSPSAIDPCLYYGDQVMMLIYIDDCLLFSPSKQAIDAVVLSLRNSYQGFNVDDQGEVKDFLGIKIRKQTDGSIMLTQPHLINSIIQDLQLQSNSQVRETPALSTVILHKDEQGKPMDQQANFHYRSVIGKLNFLEKSTRPDISYAVHQCARFSESPKESHAKAVKLIGRYLLGTRNKGIILQPDGSKSFECWADADFSGNWKKQTAHKDPMTSKSRSGWIITFAGCPITWASKLQTLTALSTTEAEYIALSTALREQIYLMELVKEIQAHGIKVTCAPPKVFCKAFEDNSGALEMARLPKLRPRTKHLNVSYHHFREYVDRKEIEILAVPTTEQNADVLTKPLDSTLFLSLRQRLLGW
ncbi:hypothetical protein ACA910_020453 [Epithemia clementina (nom. ined.)]